MIDFKAIHTLIKDHMKTKGFKYSCIDKWFNFELGVFPAATHNNGYTIKPGAGSKTEEYEADDWFDTPWSIEFCLSSVNDTYLKHIGKAYETVRNLEGKSSTNIAEIEFVDLDMQNYKNHVILTMIIKITINE